jgi:ABC-type branched-subunit amino acid transport system substrate-binding protein
MRILRSVAIAACLSLITGVAACAGPDKEETAAYAGAFLYGSDGNMQNGFAKGFEKDPGMLSGMKGTAPLTRLPEDFLARLRTVDPGLKDFLFAGETYDAVMVAAIATQLSGTTDPKTVSKQVNGATTGADVCSTAVDCLALARAGRDPAYRGIAVRHGFTNIGEPSTASYGTFHFGPDNQLDQAKTEYLNTGNENAASTEPAPRPVVLNNYRNSGAPLVLGGLLPAEGGLSFAYPPMIAGARLAVKEINAAGGVLGDDVVWRDGNDFTDPAKALGTVAKHKTDGVHIIIGAGASGVSARVLPEVVAAGMIMISPSNTAASLSNVDDQGLYFRTAPSDILQARALADIVSRDGARRVCIIARKDNYGEGLMRDVKKELVLTGLAESSICTFAYDLGDGGMAKDVAQFESIARDILGVQPDGVIVLGFEESSEAIKALATAGMTFRR